MESLNPKTKYCYPVRRYMETPTTSLTCTIDHLSCLSQKMKEYPQELVSSINITPLKNGFQVCFVFKMCPIIFDL